MTAEQTDCENIGMDQKIAIDNINSSRNEDLINNDIDMEIITEGETINAIN